LKTERNDEFRRFAKLSPNVSQEHVRQLFVPPKMTFLVGVHETLGLFVKCNFSRNARNLPAIVAVPGERCRKRFILRRHLTFENSRQRLFSRAHRENHLPNRREVCDSSVNATIQLTWLTFALVIFDRVHTTGRVVCTRRRQTGIAFCGDSDIQRTCAAMKAGMKRACKPALYCLRECLPCNSTRRAYDVLAFAETHRKKRCIIQQNAFADERWCFKYKHAYVRRS